MIAHLEIIGRPLSRSANYFRFAAGLSHSDGLQPYADYGCWLIVVMMAIIVRVAVVVVVVVIVVVVTGNIFCGVKNFVFMISVQYTHHKN